MTEQKILSELKQQRDFLQAQEKSFLNLQESKREDALELSRKELEYLALEREVITNREMYNTLLAKVKELSLAGESDLNNIRIVEPAGLPTIAMGNRNTTLLLGGVLGLFLGIGLAFFLEYLENTVRTPDDVAQHLGLSVLGVVPQIAEANGTEVPPIIVQEGARDVPAEVYRSLRTNLFFSGTENSLKTIMIASAGPKEGKSITVANLGVVLAQAGQKVLLVDADLRRPRLHRIFEADRSVGLLTVLTDEATLDEAVVETDIPNLSILSSGKLPVNPSEILGSAQMKDLIARVRDQYDVVLFDSAPILGRTDAAVLAAETDGTILVIKTGEATRKALKMVVTQLERVEAQICGVVLNSVDVKKDRYYYYYYYYYYSPYDDDEALSTSKKRLNSSFGKASKHIGSRAAKEDISDRIMKQEVPRIRRWPERKQP